jgi:glutamine synthetase
VAALGERLCATWAAIKGAELERWAAELQRVTAWEREEYAHHL